MAFGWLMSRSASSLAVLVDPHYHSSPSKAGATAEEVPVGLGMQALVLAVALGLPHCYRGSAISLSYGSQPPTRVGGLHAGVGCPVVATT
ncbi:hypothetical protein EDB89DRAFT_1980093 [Lactarius sanguifluus]|nr:hypothetical protein EDB89DRAFT_1980093 [Lactarius sanguifluus]